MLTQNQQKALDFRSHLSITANAGAGKTAVLVQRFIEILLRTPTRINEVVAITFTEKAASELRKKIAEKVEEGVHHAATPGEKQVFKRIRDELASAIIGTIHSFCARLLREYPVEADVDAAFTVLEGVDQRLLVEDALQETFELILSDNGVSSQRGAFLDLVGMLGRTTVQQYLNVMLTRREQIERLIAGPLAENRPDEEILQERKSLLVLEASRRLEEGEWRKSLSRIVVEAKGKSAPEVKERLDQWTPTMDPAAMIAIYKQISDLVFTKKGTLREAFVGAGMEGSSTKTECEALSGFHAEIGQLISDLTDPLAAEAERGLLRSTRILLHLYRRCTEVYEVKKSQFGLLDFEDLQLKARGLLRNDEIRGRLAGKLKHIMVDEFQDTNRLQYEILQLLVSHYATGNLFIVGDPKQSIYGFRNAEVEVFEKARREIASSITLSESFRPLPNLAAFVNRVFSRLMGHSSSPFDVRYDELVKGRSETAAGGVELFLIPEDESDEPEPDNDPGKRSAVETECRMIARRIAELKNSNYLMYDRKHGTSPRHFEFDDAAVLLRDRRHVREIEKALFEFNIPYALSGGIGFYQTQEVSDILNYFRFLLNPDDDIALSGILRSPFFAISDAELYEISIEGEGNTLWQKALRHADRQQADRSLSRAVMVLTDNLSQVHRLSIPLLAQRIFLQTGWHGTLRGLPSGLQQVANIKKLIAIARDFEGKGSTTLYDFVERLTTLVAEQEREGQASVGSPGNCVHVMTIHAAKGLEFPVVFLPFTHQALRYDHPPYIDSDIGITFKVSEAPDSDEGSSSPLYNYLRSRSRARTANEEKRIFYVACTRARDLLILTGQHAEKPPSPSYLSWLFEGLGEEFDASREGMQTFQHSKLKVLVEENDRFTVKEIPHRLAVAVRFPDNTETVGTENPTIRSEFLEPPELLIDPLPAQTSGEFFSATQIRTYLECPTKYYLKYVLGIPEREVHLYEADESEEPGEPHFGELEGKISHAVLQHIHSPAMPEAAVQAIVQQRVSADPYSVTHGTGDLSGAIVQNVLGFMRSASGAEILSAKEAATELPISMIFGDDFLTGTIDRLYKDETGNWNIVDYKTDSLHVNEIPAKVNVYEPQLAFYALLIRSLYRQGNVGAWLVFLRQPGSPVRINFTCDDLNKFENSIRGVISRIKSSQFERNIAQCKTCSYRVGSGCLLDSYRRS